MNPWKYKVENEVARSATEIFGNFATPMNENAIEIMSSRASLDTSLELSSLVL